VHLTGLHAGGHSAFGRLKSDVLALLRRATGVEPRVERGAFASLHPGKAATLRIGERVVGYVGVVDPRLAHAYDVADTTALATVFVESLPGYRVPRYVAPSRFPPVERDLAVIVSLDVPAGDLIDAIHEEPLVRTATPFDEYRGPQAGEGKKSLAVRIILQSEETTLTDEQADAALARIVTTLRTRFEAEPRA
jgi:phenylalanyl-tRNA synthetase beta chain